jgi:hypothetical protein
VVPYTPLRPLVDILPHVCMRAARSGCSPCAAPTGQRAKDDYYLAQHKCMSRNIAIFRLICVAAPPALVLFVALSNRRRSSHNWRERYLRRGMFAVVVASFVISELIAEVKLKGNERRTRSLCPRVDSQIAFSSRRAAPQEASIDAKNFP